MNQVHNFLSFDQIGWDTTKLVTQIFTRLLNRNNLSPKRSERVAERHGEKWKMDLRRRKEIHSHVFQDLQDTAGHEEMIVDGQLTCVINFPEVADFSKRKQLIHARSCSM